jgi:hypothetical protein
VTSCSVKRHISGPASARPNPIGTRTPPRRSLGHLMRPFCQHHGPIRPEHVVFGGSFRALRRSNTLKRILPPAGAAWQIDKDRRI